ncbi:hypothetical protein GALMADRAFT_144075 [Galerina marginata CBS 339.88]|uniref:Uncharacterized protein n=1 Tax=Galerina marginata (strain CBS 339.88) TaxID=685588 RepID=A0A067SJ85_GALM3|nr:hypothetical protein GALMADRAFT_144075 [Galerina marginata CBS 339.88]
MKWETHKLRCARFGNNGITTSETPVLVSLGCHDTEEKQQRDYVLLLVLVVEPSASLRRRLCVEAIAVNSSAKRGLCCPCFGCAGGWASTAPSRARASARARTGDAPRRGGRFASSLPNLCAVSHDSSTQPFAAMAQWRATQRCCTWAFWRPTTTSPTFSFYQPTPPNNHPSPTSFSSLPRSTHG